MRLVVARCEVHYVGRLTAVLPEAVRLLVFKADGSVLVHDDAGGYKPLNCIRKEFRPGGSLCRARKPTTSRASGWRALPREWKVLTRQLGVDSAHGCDKGLNRVVDGLPLSAHGSEPSDVLRFD